MVYILDHGQPTAAIRGTPALTVCASGVDVDPGGGDEPAALADSGNRCSILRGTRHCGRVAEPHAGVSPRRPTMATRSRCSASAVGVPRLSSAATYASTQPGSASVAPGPARSHARGGRVGWAKIVRIAAAPASRPRTNCPSCACAPIGERWADCGNIHQPCARIVPAGGARSSPGHSGRADGASLTPGAAPRRCHVFKRCGVLVRRGGCRHAEWTRNRRQ